MSQTYLREASHIWAVSREINGRRVCLVQDAPIQEVEDAETILLALNIAPNKVALDTYFPILGERGRCPTLDVMELTSRLDPTNPIHKVVQKAVARV
jgi:hypothetical protein